MTIAVGDQVLVVNPTSNTTVGAGAISDGGGDYLISMSVAQSLNGTSLTLEYSQASKVYQLLANSSSQPINFIFEGSFPFPATITENLTIGSVVSTAPATVSGTGSTTPTTNPTTATVCPCGLPNCDVNGDGVFDEADISAIKNALISRNPNPKADVNADGVVNINDLLAALQALAGLQMNPGEGVVAGASCSGSTGTTTATGTTTTGTTTTGTTTSGTTGTTTTP